MVRHGRLLHEYASKEKGGLLRVSVVSLAKDGDTVAVLHEIIMLDGESTLIDRSDLGYRI